jgi:predicted 2-oxoglutarate/Fe(II)-dependent dioxygenase YbiX
MNSLEDYIVVIKNAVTSNLCDAIIMEYADCDDWASAIIGAHESIDKTIRNCSTIGMSFQNVIEKNKNVRAALDKYMHVSVGEILRKYNKNFLNCRITEDTGYKILRYTEGQFYTQHTDSFKEHPRSVTASIILNDNYEGGEFAFFNRKLSYRLEKGDAILFPSNFMYPHEIMPVTKGTRYSIVTWFV